MTLATVLYLPGQLVRAAHRAARDRCPIPSIGLTFFILPQNVSSVPARRRIEKTSGGALICLVFRLVIAMIEYRGPIATSGRPGMNARATPEPKSRLKPALKSEARRRAGFTRLFV
jgi:hypothetical protein